MANRMPIARELAPYRGNGDFFAQKSNDAGDLVASDRTVMRAVSLSVASEVARNFAGGVTCTTDFQSVGPVRARQVDSNVRGDKRCSYWLSFVGCPMISPTGGIASVDSLLALFGLIHASSIRRVGHAELRWQPVGFLGLGVGALFRVESSGRVRICQWKRKGLRKGHVCRTAGDGRQHYVRPTCRS
jgi:hypothetical protein